jgi:hypothetical protein
LDLSTGQKLAVKGTREFDSQVFVGIHFHNQRLLISFSSDFTKVEAFLLAFTTSYLTIKRQFECFGTIEIFMEVASFPIGASHLSAILITRAGHVKHYELQIYRF